MAENILRSMAKLKFDELSLKENVVLIMKRKFK
jgi:hypothetical protein